MSSKKGDQPFDEQKSDIEENPINWRVLLLRTLLIMITVLTVYGIASILFRKQLMQIGIWMGEHLGYTGVGIYVYLVDTIIVPTTADVVFPFAMEWNAPLLLFVMSMASILGGFSGYWIARGLNHFGPVQRMTQSYRQRGEAMINRYGAWAVVIGGLTPIPFSTICWIAGLLKVSAGKVFLASLSRLPRMVIYYIIIKSGINLARFFFLAV